MTLPNILTCIRVLLIPVFMALAYQEGDGFQTAALAVYVIACLTDYVDGKLAESKLLYTDKYKGNPPEVSIGTGAPLASGQTPDPAWQPYGTALEDAN